MNRFPNGARVCFIGDSLVARNQQMPMLIEYYNRNFPNSDIRFFNCGVSGGTAKYANESFEDDTMLCKPTHAVVAFGVNDSGRTRLEKPRGEERYAFFLERFERYKKNLTELCEKIVSRGIELILCTPAPYDEYSQKPIPALRGGYALIAEYAHFVRTLAKEKGYALVDYHEYLSRMLQDENEAESIFSEDRVHPTAHGFDHMVKCFLEALGLGAPIEQDPPAYFGEWRDKLFIFRSIHATECMIIGKYDLPPEEQRAIVEEYLAQKKWSTPYFETIAKRYLEFKPRQVELAEEIFAIYDRDILNYCE